MKAEHHLHLRDAGAVKRCHTMRVPSQTLAEHQWGVAMLVLTVWPDAPSDLIKAALTHDLPEHVTGDIPATAKWDNPRLEIELKTIEQAYKNKYYLHSPTLHLALLKWCDKAEFALYMIEQLKTGNRYALEGLTNIMPTLATPPYRCGEMYRIILTEADHVSQ